MPEVIKEQCPVCKGEVRYVVSNMLEIEEQRLAGIVEDFSDPIYKQAYGDMCDFADDRGCFKTYCPDCFDKHTCGAFPQKG